MSEIPIQGFEPPSPAVREELVAILQEDSSRIGDVYRGTCAGRSAEEIASDLGVETSGFVWGYRKSIALLLEGELPTGAKFSAQLAGRVRQMLKTLPLSEDARRYLKRCQEELQARTDDEGARAVEDVQAQQHTETAEAANLPGIYVYALPHYLRYPYDPDSGRTLMKVGRSGSDTIERFKAQTRTTALPEEPELLRIYGCTTEEAATMESQFHRLLSAADHSRSVARTAGREWFVTSTRFLDEVARAMNLRVNIINDAGAAEDL